MFDPACSSLFLHFNFLNGDGLGMPNVAAWFFPEKFTMQMWISKDLLNLSPAYGFVGSRSPLRARIFEGDTSIQT
jgi:hypothetical protein